jgi:hypothetical protein
MQFSVPGLLWVLLTIVVLVVVRAGFRFGVPIWRKRSASSTTAPGMPAGRQENEQMEEHAVIARFDYAAKNLDPLFSVEKQLEAAINAAGVGEFDGNEIAVDLHDGFMYMYGPDAEALFAVARPILANAGCLRNTHVTLRFGPPTDGVRERQEILSQ